MRNVYLQTYRSDTLRLKVAYFFRKMTSEENNSKILRIKKGIFSGYYFCANMNIIIVKFHICISASLMLNSMLHIFCQLYFPIDWPLLFQKCFPLFSQTRIFSTCFTSTIFGNMQSALL